MFKLNRNNYYRSITDINKKLIDVNDEFIKLVNEIGVKIVNLTSVGNSIATGYSISDITKPMLLRNDDLINKCNFDLNIRSYVRAQDNNDEHILSWIINNSKQSDINRKVQYDFINDNGIPHDTIDEKSVLEYYPINIDDDIGLYDLINIKGKNIINIIVYNGCTGSFLDNFTRHGTHKNLYGFKRDLISLESCLKLIYLTNPYTQVYICGIPNIMGIHITDLINNKIRKICKKYPNSCYVNSVPQNFIYKKDGKFIVDVHYNQNEYLDLNKSIIDTIVNNYIPTRALTEFDIAMRNYSTNCEYGNNLDINSVLNEIFSKYSLSSEYLKRLSNYYKERYPYDFYHTPRNDVIDYINLRKKEKKLHM